MVQASAAAIDHSGNVVIADCTRVRVVAVRAGRFYGQPMSAGRIYSIAGHGFNLDRCYGQQSSESGDGGPARSAGINATRVTLDAAGSIVVADAGNRGRGGARRTGHV